MPARSTGDAAGSWTITAIRSKSSVVSTVKKPMRCPSSVAMSWPTSAGNASALVALSAAYNERSTDEMCALWLAALPSLDDQTGALIAAHLTNGDLQVANQHHYNPYNWQLIFSDVDKCPAGTVDAALTLIARRVAAHTARDYWWVVALEGPARSTNATPAQRRKAAAIARRYVADPSYNDWTRDRAREALALLRRR